MIPEMLQAALKETAAELAADCQHWHWPNDGRDAPTPEHNLVAKLHTALKQQSKDCKIYLEAVIKNRNGRVDMIVDTGTELYIIEAKTAGGLRDTSLSCMADLNSILDYKPLPSKNVDATENPHPADNVQWNNKEKKVWACIIIWSFRGDEVARAWESTNTDGTTLNLPGRKQTHEAFLELRDQFLPDDRMAWSLELYDYWTEKGYFGKSAILCGVKPLPRAVPEDIV